MRQRATSALYDRDFALWIEQQIEVIRRGARDGRLREFDVDNVIEELEGLAKRDRRSVESLFTTLAVHLLKLYVQPERASRSWLGSIISRSERMRRILEDSPSLESNVSSFLRDGYADARIRASAETGLTIDAFPVDPTEQFLAGYQAALAGQDFGGEAIVKVAEGARQTHSTTRGAT